MRHVSEDENWWRIKRLNAAFAAEPEAVVLSLACMMSGVAALAGLRPMSIQLSLDEVLQELWSLSLLVGGLLRTWGLLTRRPRVDGTGALMLAWATLLFGAAAITSSRNAIVGALVITAFGYGSFLRWRSYYRLGKAKQKAEKDG